MREVRQVVMNLRSHLSAANEEIKRLSNSKMSLERCLEHLIKDIRVNQETINLRKMKPKRESEPDKADSMLNYEKEGLKAEKRVMENKIFESRDQLKVLDKTRLDLNLILDERNQVLDLLAEHVRPGGQVHKVNRGGRLEASNDMITNTTDAKRVDMEMMSELKNSKQLRHENKSLINCAYIRQADLAEKVQAALSLKVAHTVSLEQRLTSAECQNRSLANKLNRKILMTESSKGYLLGAETSADITTREKLTRPIVKIFQRHPGTDLSESNRIELANKKLDFKIKNAQNDSIILRRAKTDIEMDKNDKRVSSAIDLSLMRLRRQRSSHRWVPNNKKRFGSASEATIRAAVITPWYKP